MIIREVEVNPGTMCFTYADAKDRDEGNRCRGGRTRPGA